MSILLVGANGQLGREIVAQAALQKLNLHAFTHQELDITSVQHIHDSIAVLKPRYIINAAAYTQVDKAELEKSLAFGVNAEGVRYLAQSARQFDIPLLHISTDYVFDGMKKIAYTEEDCPNPLSIYGQSKLMGELFLRQTWHKHIILRVSWVFGCHGRNFVKTILKLAKEKPALSIVCDQYGGPTYAGDIADTLLTIIGMLKQGHHAWGTYHYSGLPIVNWQQFACSIVEKAKQSHNIATKSILPISTAQYKTHAQRPLNSSLLSDKINKTFHIPTKNWEIGLKEVIQGL